MIRGTVGYITLRTCPLFFNNYLLLGPASVRQCKSAHASCRYLQGRTISSTHPEGSTVHWVDNRRKMRGYMQLYKI